MKEGLVSSLERGSVSDGPGIRYVIRLQGCPMKCAYCGYPETWGRFRGTWMSIEEILEDVLKAKEESAGLHRMGGVTISGGEPMMQMEFLLDMSYMLKENGFHV